MINWIAEVTMDNSEGWKQSDWFRQVETAEFAHHFDGWVWDWLDVPDLIRRADSAFENPMIDRDPIPTWQDGPVVLMGDAAHPMYPTGSNGGSQAIVDARVLGACMIELGVTPARYVEQVRVEAARRRLEEGDAGVEQVAAGCGFGSSETMRRAFLRSVRVSPSEYRQRFRPSGALREEEIA